MIQYIIITSANETRTPPDKPVLRISMDPQNAKLEILEDIYDDEPIAVIDVRHIDLGQALNFLGQQSKREAERAAAIDMGNSITPPAATQTDLSETLPRPEPNPHGVGTL